MLLVNTYLAESPIEGIGLFAAEDIAKGTTIWRFDARFDRKFSKAERAALPEPAYTFVQKYSYPESVGSDVYYLDGDHARFMNHSDTPNTDSETDTVATRDIRAGEELLCNYHQFHPSHVFSPT